MLRITINQPEQDLRELTHPAGPIELGRGAGNLTVPRCRIPDKYVSKDHLRVCELPSGRVQVENISTTNPATIGETVLAVGSAQELDLPLQILLGETRIDIAALTPEGLAADPDHSVPGGILRTILRTTSTRDPGTSQPFLSIRGSLTPERLLSWFETVVAVQKAAAGSPEFFVQAAQALVDLVGLDRGFVLLRRGADWETASACSAPGAPQREPSQGILRSILLRKQTTYRSVDAASRDTAHQADEVVAAPIFDAGDEVVGVLYGARDLAQAPGATSLGPVEAQVVQLLAAVVGTGLARQQQEAEATRSRVQFEQFFSPELAEHLSRDPGLLAAQEREITVLFTDVRGFSRLVEGLGPQAVYGLMSDVMDHIAGCIRDQGGVVVDYAGDGLLAMWNAPADQADHPLRACRAALAIQARLPELETRWHEMLGTATLGVGVGINTGRALVGNTGTRFKLKYGPLGHTVNLGSRVESATRQLGIPILLTRSTFERVNDRLATRRLCRAHVSGIDEPVDLFELHGESATPEWQRRSASYEKGLASYELQRFADACQQVYPLLADPTGQVDIPTLTLLARAVEALKNPPRDFDPAIRIGKT